MHLNVAFHIVEGQWVMFAKLSLYWKQNKRGAGWPGRPYCLVGKNLLEEGVWGERQVPGVVQKFGSVVTCLRDNRFTGKVLQGDLLLLRSGGSAVRIRPEQVVRWILKPSEDGEHVLAVGSAASPSWEEKSMLYLSSWVFFLIFLAGPHGPHQCEKFKKVLWRTSGFEQWEVALFWNMHIA